MQASLAGARLVVRADAGPTCGAGHVMRCLALMQAWRARGGEPMLATAACPDSLVARIKAGSDAHVVNLRSAPASIADADETAAIALQAKAPWVVIDGYDFGADYVARVQRAGVRVLLLDDLGRRGRTGAAIVLNQNLHATGAYYLAEDESTQRLLGLDYFLLRAEFWPWRGWTRGIPPKARRVGIALGAADPADHTRRLIRAFDNDRCEDIEFAVIVGAANPRLGEIRAAAGKATANFTVQADVTDMARCLAGIDLLVSSAGVTAWEAAFLSTPMVLGTVGPQEEALAHRLAGARACIHLGPFETLSDAGLSSWVRALVEDRSVRLALASACAPLIDGFGPQRVIDAMLHQKVLATC